LTTCSEVQVINCLGILKNTQRPDGLGVMMKAQRERQGNNGPYKTGRKFLLRRTHGGRGCGAASRSKRDCGVPGGKTYRSGPQTIALRSSNGFARERPQRVIAVAEFVGFLEQNKRVWLMVVGTIVGLIVLVTAAQRGLAWFGEKRERKQEQAVASVTPEHLLARCGQPLEDTTKNVYSILMRTMTYQISRNETYIFGFSRTAEETSDWVFLSMKDGNGKSYETAEEKVSAMSCLNSRK